MGDLVRGGAQRLKDQFARQFGFRIQAVHHMFGMLRHLAQGFRAVQMLAANNEPYFIVIKIVIFVSLMGERCLRLRGFFRLCSRREIVLFRADRPLLVALIELFETLCLRRTRLQGGFPRLAIRCWAAGISS